MAGSGVLALPAAFIGTGGEILKTTTKKHTKRKLRKTEVLALLDTFIGTGKRKTQSWKGPGHQ